MAWGLGTEAGTVIRNGGLVTGAKDGYGGWTEVWYEGQGIDKCRDWSLKWLLFTICLVQDNA